MGGHSLRVVSTHERTGDLAHQSSGVVIRSASQEDADFISRAILMATRSQLNYGFWDAVFNTTEEECLRSLRILTTSSFRSWNHFSRFLIAELNGQAASTLSAYDSEEAGVILLFEAMEDMFKILQLSTDEQFAIWKRMESSGSCVPRHEPGSWVIENAATVPDYRQKGLATALLLRALEIGRERGYEIAGLNVLMGNKWAQRLYEKSGFIVVEEKTDSEYERRFGVPGVRKMVYSLQQ